ncbi:MAG: hypothetical protein KME21_30770 [Desmonostoc vinosum HA7617-LM4]|jgi:hypothetical protein|nr:hypothetical protein [Desmonostoc vinosum HA7617-LM4]
MDIFENKAQELQQRLHDSGQVYSLNQVKLALAQWLVQASYHLIDNATDYIYGDNHPIAQDSFKPEDFLEEKRIATIKQYVK